MTMAPRSQARSLLPLDTGILSPNPTWGGFLRLLSSFVCTGFVSGRNLIVFIPRKSLNLLEIYDRGLTDKRMWTTSLSFAVKRLKRGYKQQNS